MGWGCSSHRHPAPPRPAEPPLPLPPPPQACRAGASTAVHAGHMPGTPGLLPHAAPSVTSTAAGAPWAQPPSSGHPGKVTGTTGRPAAGLALHLLQQLRPRSAGCGRAAALRSDLPTELHRRVPRCGLKPGGSLGQKWLWTVLPGMSDGLGAGQIRVGVGGAGMRLWAMPVRERSFRGGGRGHPAQTELQDSRGAASFRG